MIKGLEAIGAIAKVLLKGLELIDPKTRDWVRKRKALDWGERYILTNEQLKTEKNEKKIKYLKKKLRYYKKWFFAYD